MINDIWGLKWDERLAPLLAKEDVACCLMHNRDNQEYTNFIEDFCSDMEETLAIAKRQESGTKELFLIQVLALEKHLSRTFLL